MISCVAPIPRLATFPAFDAVRDADFLNQMLYLDTKIFMASLNLNYNDKMSMASSVEVRVPFLDRELAEFAAWNLPPDLKLKGFFHPHPPNTFSAARCKMYCPPKCCGSRKSRVRRSGGLLAGERFARDGRRSALGDETFGSAACFVQKPCGDWLTNTASARRIGRCKSGSFLTLENWMRIFFWIPEPSKERRSSLTPARPPPREFLESAETQARHGRTDD